MKTLHTAVGFFILPPLFFLIGCSFSEKVSGTNALGAVDSTLNWKEADAKFMAGAIVKDVLSRPWIDLFKNGKQSPHVRIDTVRNRSTEDIPMMQLIHELEQELSKSKRITLIPKSDEPVEIRTDQADTVSDDSMENASKQIKPDYLIRGDFNSRLIQDSTGTTKYYKINLELVEAETGHRYWAGEQMLKKSVPLKSKAE